MTTRHGFRILPSDRRTWAMLGGSVLLLALLVGYLVWWYVPNTRRNVEQTWRQRLALMAEDRVAGIDRVVRSGEAMARLIADDSVVRDAVTPGGRGSDAQQLSALIHSIVTAHDFRAVRILNSELHLRALSLQGDTLPVPMTVAREVMATGVAQTILLPRGTPTTIVVVAPVSRTSRVEQAAAVGAVVLEGDAIPLLGALATSRPVEGSTVEIVLAQRDPDGRITFFTPSIGTIALAERSYTTRDTALAMAWALRIGDTVGAFEDYAHRPVLAATRRAHAAPWGVVAKVDRAELDALVRREWQRAMALVGAAWLGLLGFGFGIWRDQRARHHAALARAGQGLMELVTHANDAIFCVRSDGVILDVNQRVEELYGYTRSQLQGMRAEDLVPPEDRERARRRREDLLAHGGGVFETEQRTADGRTIQVEISTRLVQRGDRQIFFSIARDISDRRIAQDRISALLKMLRTLSETNVMISQVSDREALFQEACRIAVAFGEFPLVWAGDVQEDGAVRPVAAAGTATPYLNGFQVRWDDTPEGRGPVGWAVRENRVVAFAHLETEEQFAPWQDRAAFYHFGSCAAAPIVRSGRPVGVFCLYSTGAATFDDPEIQDVVRALAANLGAALELFDERARLNAERMALLERLRIQFERMPLPIFIATPMLEILDCNPAASALFGYTLDEMRGQSEHELLVSPAHRASVVRAIRNVASGNATTVHLHECVTKDGRAIQVEWHDTPLRDASGALVAIMGMAVDVTERRRTEERLRLLVQAVEQSPVSVLITDAATRIVYVNARFTAVTGYTMAEVEGRTPSFLQSGTHPPEIYAEVRRTFQSGRVWRGELQNRRKDGSLVWERVSISPVIDEGGTITHYLGINEDITERKQLEEQFHQAQRMEAVGRLAGGVAHDFNNLLTVILGRADLLLHESTLPAPVREDLDDIYRAGSRAADLTRQLLAFSRRQVLQPRIVESNDAVTGVERILRRLIGEDVRLTTVLAPDAGRIRVDPGQFEQVLLNLAVNARDAMPKGGDLLLATENVTVTEEHEHHGGVVGPGEYVRLTVRDSGIGMDAATRARIFEPFFTTKKERGTGLGLATVYGIVKQSGGTIWCDSEVNRGTTFAVLFPRVFDAVLPALSLGPRSEPRRDATILVVEDEEDVRHLVRSVLRGQGYLVMEADDGESALDRCRSHTTAIDLILADVVLPGIDGREFVERARELHPEARVLFMSGYTADAMLERGLAGETLALLQKPFTGETLLDRVGGVLAR